MYLSDIYSVFQPNTRKILISRDVNFMENKKWSWNNAEIQQPLDLLQDELVDDPPVRGTRLLVDIYQMCNVVVLELTGYLEAEKDPQ